MRSALVLLALATALATPACSTDTDTDTVGESSDDITTGGVTAAVEAKLRVTNPSEEGKTWLTTRGNALPGSNWLMQVPVKETWGLPFVEPGRSDDAILSEIYNVMIQAEYSLDVASLWAPTGGFLETMREALTELDRQNRRVVARFLFAEYPGYDPQIERTLAALTRDLRGTSVSVSVAQHRRRVHSWNHSKIIAVDGKDAIIGGMNLKAEHYLEAEPVHDVSIHVRGPVAAASQTYVNELWAVACNDRGAIQGNRNDQCPPAFAPREMAAEGNVRMIAVGRLGNSFRNPADKALIAMMDASRKSIRISQQDLGSYRLAGAGAFPDDVLDAFTRAARRGKDVTVILTNEDAYGGTSYGPGDVYANGWSLKQLWRALKARQESQWPSEGPAICRHVHFAGIRMSQAPTWPSGRPLANHAKVVIIDDQAHYVGSQNLYSADLAEFGVIVDDQPATRTFISEYWNQLSLYSLPTAYRDPGCN